MKKLFNLRLLLLFPLVFLFVLQYRNSHTWSLLFNIGITLLFAVLVLMYIFVLYKGNNEPNKNKTIVKVGIIVCIAFSIVFLRPYAENDVLDYKFNSYSTVENAVTGKMTENTLKETTDWELVTVELLKAKRNIKDYISKQNISEYRVIDIIEQDGHYFFAVYMEIESSTTSQRENSHFIVELDSDLEVIRSVPITFNHYTIFDNIRILQSDNDSIYYASHICKHKSDYLCNTSTIHSIDKDNNVTDHFMIKETRVIRGAIKNGTLYVMKNSVVEATISLLKYSMNGELMQEETIDYDVLSYDLNMLLEDDIIYINIFNYGKFILYSFDLNLEYVDDTIIYKNTQSTEVNTSWNDKQYSIEKHKSNYFIDSTYNLYTLNKTGDKVYLSNKDNIYYQVNDDSGDVNILKYKNLITNPTIIILSFLFFFTFICDLFTNYRNKITLHKDKNHISVRDYYEPFTYLNREEK